jgi:hypothetical protein
MFPKRWRIPCAAKRLPSSVGSAPWSWLVYALTRRMFHTSDYLTCFDWIWYSISTLKLVTAYLIFITSNNSTLYFMWEFIIDAQVCTHTIGNMACFWGQLASSSSTGQYHWVWRTELSILNTELVSSAHGHNFHALQPFWQNFAEGRDGHMTSALEMNDHERQQTTSPHCRHCNDQQVCQGHVRLWRVLTHNSNDRSIMRLQTGFIAQTLCAEINKTASICVHV